MDLRNKCLCEFGTFMTEFLFHTPQLKRPYLNLLINKNYVHLWMYHGILEFEHLVEWLHQVNMYITLHRYHFSVVKPLQHLLAIFKYKTHCC